MNVTVPVGSASTTAVSLLKTFVRRNSGQRLTEFGRPTDGDPPCRWTQCGAAGRVGLQTGHPLGCQAARGGPAGPMTLSTYSAVMPAVRSRTLDSIWSPIQAPVITTA